MTRYCVAVILFAALAFVSGAQTGELPRSAPEEQGVSQELLDGLYHRLINLPDVDIHHIMILRHGKVIGELHADPYQADDLHTLYSASKTVTALAVGLAVDDGLLAVDDKVSKYLSDKMPAKLSPALDSLTVRHLLMMASGRLEDLSILLGEDDWLTTWFKGDFHDVGKRFHYDSMCTHALAVIVTRLTGKPLLEYLRERIFTPMHIVQTDWELAPDSVEAAGWGLRLQAESEAKLGLLMLQGGEWNGKQLVSRKWIHDMTQRYLSTEEGEAPQLSFWEKIKRFFRHLWHTVRSWFTGYNVDDYYLGYGYQTKTILQPRAESFFAAGYGGQLIDVIPKLDMVIVINGRAANYGHELNTIYYHFLDPLISGKQSAVEVPPVNLSIEMPQGDATHSDEIRLLGNTVILEDNLLGLKSIELTRNGEDHIFTMNDRLGALRAVASCGEWRITTDNERPIYIMESREQLIGVPGPFKMAAAYAWQNDTLSLRLDWLDGGDNRRLKMAFDGNDVTVIVNDNFDALLTDTIQGKLGVRN